METSKKPARIDALQGVRAIAFMGIYLYHALRTFPGESAVCRFLAKSPGPWGVSVFFVLSGFLMTYSYWNRPPGYTIRDALLLSIRKIRKLYPLHLVMLSFGAVYLILRREPIPGLLKQLAITIPLIQTWFPVHYQAINSVAWFLSVCVFSYFCFPFLLEQMKRSRQKWAPYAGIAGIFSAQLLIGYCVFRFTAIDIKWITYCHPVFRLGDFAIGCFLADIYLGRKPAAGSKPPVSKHWSSALELIAIAFNVLACVICAIAPGNTAWFRYTALFIPSTVMLIYVFSLDRGAVSGSLANRFVFWLASISPYAFLIHRLVLYYFHAFTKYVLHCAHVPIIIAVFIPFLITVLAVYLYQTFEKAAVSAVKKNRKE